MSGLATRCPACSTIFRVVIDQLRVSDGWVRCGRCAEVFNAAERLVDVDTGAPTRADGVTAAQGSGTADASFHDAPLAAPAAAADFVGRGAAGKPALRVAAPAPAAPAATTTRVPAIGPEPAFDSRFDDADPVHGDDEPTPAARPRPTAAWAATPPDDASDFPSTAEQANPAAATDGNGADATPSFVRRAARAERWRSPRVRRALAAAAGVAALLLAVQAVHAWRHPLAARHAALRPALEGACTLLGCNIEPPRRIEDLSVESSGLVRLEKSALYRLSVALRNRATIAVALPALELSLTDSQGALLVRRVLRAADLGVNQATVAPGAELALQATLQAALSGGDGAEPVAGYTIELFYP